MFIRRKTLRAIVQDETLKALMLHESRMQESNVRVRNSPKMLVGSEELTVQLDLERSKNTALLDEKDELIRQVKGLQQIMLATNQETLRLALVDAARTVAQEFRAQVRAEKQ